MEPLDYSKWDLVGASDSDEEPEESSGAAVRGVELLTDWVMKANPSLSSDEVAEVVSFVSSTYSRPNVDTDLSRAADIIELFESGHAPPVGPLLATVWQSRLGTFHEISATSGPSIRMAAALTSALNTLVACNGHSGSARGLFDEMWAEPDGVLAKAYADKRFAARELKRHSEEQLRAVTMSRPPADAGAAATSRPRPVGSSRNWGTVVRSAALAILGLCLALAGAAISRRNWQLMEARAVEAQAGPTLEREE